MKNSINLKSFNNYQRFLLALVFIIGNIFTSIKTFAQTVPEKVDVDINTGGDSVWYGQPWVWAIGIAIFIVIIIAITRGGSKSNA